jgi:hypothetical protein
VKPKYKFSHRAGNLYYWYSERPVDSRYVQMVCRVSWFWGTE